MYTLQVRDECTAVRLLQYGNFAGQKKIVQNKQELISGAPSSLKMYPLQKPVSFYLQCFNSRGGLLFWVALYAVQHLCDT